MSHREGAARERLRLGRAKDAVVKPTAQIVHEIEVERQCERAYAILAPILGAVFGVMLGWGL